MPWPQLVFGWPTILLALGTFGVAFAQRRSFLGFGGVALAAPFLWYTSHAPGGVWFSPVLLLALGAAAEFLRRGRRVWAAICLAPFAIVVIILAAAVLSQG